MQARNNVKGDMAAVHPRTSNFLHHDKKYDWLVEPFATSECLRTASGRRTTRNQCH